MFSLSLAKNAYTTLVGCLILQRMCLADINTFFPQIEGDLTRVTWAHAVNNQYLLNSTLLDKSVMMIEADIVMGTINGTNSSTIPIMAHPPNNVSDLSLDAFLEQVHNFNNNTNNTKGVKLDFKSFEAFDASLPKVIEYQTGKFPLWINADILTGPTNPSSIPVDADKFLGTIKQNQASLNNTVLSLGWTTTFSNNTNDNSYTDNHVTEMVNSIKNHTITNDITFAVRAALAANSLAQMKRLLNETKNSTTLTIWMSDEKDKVDVDKLRALIMNVTSSRVYLDVPEALRKKVLSNGGSRLFMPVFVSTLVAAFLVLFS